jgi:recombination protein RecT
MTNKVTTTNKQLGIKQFFEQENVKNKFQELLGKRAPQFITSVLQIVASNDLLSKAEPMSVFNAAAAAATLDLPINNNLGFAYVVPFNTKQSDGTYKTLAQLQIGAKGFLQLALRSGQFTIVNTSDVREGEIKNHNRLTGQIEFEWIQNDKERLSKAVVGYVSYFKLLNGFEHTYYMTIEQLKQHGLKYSQTFKKGYGLWKEDFENMAKKSVLKLNLSKNAPLSIDMQRATAFDQSVIKDVETEDVEYVDATPKVSEVIQKADIDKEKERIEMLIEDCKTEQDFLSLKEKVDIKYHDLIIAAAEKIK